MSPRRMRDGRATRSLMISAGALLVVVAACAPTPIGPRPPAIDQFRAEATDLTAPAVVPFSWAVRDPNRDALTCRIDFTSDGVWDDTVSPCPAAGGRNVSIGEGSATATLEVSDQSHAPVTATATYVVGPGPTEPMDIVVQQVTTPDPRVTEALADAVARWSAVIVRGVPDMVVHQDPASCTGEMPGFDGAVDDIVIDVVVIPDIAGFMGDAAPCAIGPDGLPRLSIIRLDSDWIDWLDTHDYLGDLVTHEMGHALGFGGALWWAYRQQAGTGDYRFTGPRALAEWSHLGGNSTVPLSDGGDHWDETILQSEVMTCTIENLTNHPLSALTVAAMADIGYHVDLDAAEPWALPAVPADWGC